MKKIKILVLSMIFMIVPINVCALEDWDIYKQDTVQIKLEEIKKLEETIKSTIEKLESADIYDQYTYKYSLNVVKKVSFEDQLKKKISEVLHIDKIFKTYNEALDYYNSLSVDAPYYKGDPNIEKMENDSIIHGQYSEITCENIGCEEELAILNDSLEHNESLEYSIISSTQIQYGNTTWFDYMENGVVKLFDSKLAIEEYIKQLDLAKEGWQYKDYKINDVLITNEDIKNFQEIYEEESEAVEALNKFKNDYPNYINADIIKIEDSEEDSYIYSKDTNLYLDKSLAEARKDELTSEFVFATVEEKQTNGLVQDIPDDIFDNYLDALAQLELYKSQGYVIDSYTISPNKIGYTGKVLSAKKDGSSKNYIFDEEINYVLIKQGKIGTVAVWTPIPLMPSQQEQFRKTYKEIIGGIDGSTSGDLNIKFINGYHSFDLSSLGSGWKDEYTFIKNNDGTTSLNIPSGAVSHTVSGVLEEKICNYKLTGKMHKVLTEYYVLLREFIKGYDFKVIGEAKVENSITKYQMALQYDQELEQMINALKYRINTLISEENYTLDYEKYAYDTYELATVDWQIERMTNNKESDYPLPPFTGVEFNHFGIIMVNLLGAALIFKSKK